MLRDHRVPRVGSHNPPGRCRWREPTSACLASQGRPPHNCEDFCPLERVPLTPGSIRNGQPRVGRTAASATKHRPIPAGCNAGARVWPACLLTSPNQVFTQIATPSLVSPASSRSRRDRQADGCETSPPRAGQDFWVLPARRRLLSAAGVRLTARSSLVRFAIGSALASRPSGLGLCRSSDGAVGEPMRFDIET
jgi:hypothetical protein